MKKPDRTFNVVITVEARPTEGRVAYFERCAIYGETFFAARAAMAVLDRVEPGAIRLDPPARHS